MFNVNTSRPLIPRQQSYVLNRELVTVHSEDRDIKKWKNPNHFEVELPKIMENVESMRLIDCTLPSCHRTFTNDYQNTKMSFTLTVAEDDPIYNVFSSVNKDYIFTITIQEGFYCPNEMAREIENKMNEIITDYLVNRGELAPYTYFKVYYDKVGLRYWFGNEFHKFSLLFNKKEEYKIIKCRQPEMWEKYVKWGLPFYLGFKKEIYNGMPNPKAISFSYLGSNATWMEPKITTTEIDSSPSLSNSDTQREIKYNGDSLLRIGEGFLADGTGWKDLSAGISNVTLDTETQNMSETNPVFFVKAPNSPDLIGEKVIYMEIKKYNNYNEIMPYSENTNSLMHNDYSGRVNSCFAKIPITSLPLGEYSESRNGFLNNVKSFDVPEEKISKLLVTFRFHDGRLVEFENGSLNFTVAFNCLKNEIQKTYVVRVPNAYSL
uniref:Uncharacterized protein n=1 Tax=viral metagenome TaxID=1070528 RepID=A0A6C0JET6_9ZZZZ